MCAHNGPVTAGKKYGRLLAAVAGLSIGLSSACAQMSWIGGTGSWNIASNWTPANVPDNTGETATIGALGSYVVSLTGSVNVGAVTLTNPNGLLNINNSLNFGLAGGGLSNDSTVTINPTAGSSGTSIQLLASQPWNGSGAVVLNANAGNLETAIIGWTGGGESITQGEGHSILGTGRVYTYLTNNGTVNANVAGRTLWLSNQSKINNNLFAATGGGTLLITTPVDQTGGGRIDADGGSLRLGGGSSISGGSINVFGGGDASTNPGGTTWSGVTLTGPFGITNNTPLYVSNSLTNNGTLTINPSGGSSSTFLQLLNSVALNGTGVLALNANPGNIETAVITWSGGGEVLTQAATHTIRGSGRIYSHLINNGNVDADISGRSLLLSNQAKTNNNLMTASGGAFLDIACTVTQGPGAAIRAINGTARHSSATINGGFLSTTGTGLHQVTVGSRWNSVTLSGLGAVENSVFLQLADALTLNGTLTVNRTAGSSSTGLQVLNSMGIAGAGTIVLNANAGNLATANITWNGGGEVLTLGANQTVRGTGQVNVNTTNNGLIHADISSRTLQLLGQPKVNNALIRASNNATLLVSGISITQAAAAEILADAGAVQFSGATVIGGGVRAINGGLCSITANSRFDGVTASGPLEVNNSTNLQLHANLVNNGTITVNPTAGGSGTLLQALSSQNLGGTGEVVLNASTNLDTAYITYSGGGEVLTHAATHTIRGTGNIHVNLLNNGLVNADRAGRILSLRTTNKSNNATMKATNGGTLSVNGILISQSPGAQLLGDGGTVLIAGGHIVGGHMNAMNDGMIDFSSNNRADGITLAGPARIFNGSSLQIHANLVNNGTITVNPTAGGNGTFVQALSTQGLNGTGEVVLNASTNLDTAYITYNGGGEVLTHAATHTIRGTGRVYVSLANDGLVHADRDARVLELLGISKTNNATMKSSNGGILAVTSIGLTQAPTAQLLGDGGSVRIFGTTISGGQVNATNGGLSSVTGNSRFNTVSISGPFHVNNGVALQIADGLTNNGTITVNPSMSSSGTFIQVLNSQTFGGSGAIYLNANPANLDTGYIFYNGAGEVLINGEGHTIGGTGRIYVRTHNNGILSPGRPGSPIGLLNLQGVTDLSFGATGEFHCQLAGSGDANADRITSSRPITLDGVCRVSIVPPFVASRDESWTIITAPSITGAFAELAAPPAVNGIGYRLEYFSNRVVLHAVCYADVNNDGGIDGADVQAFYDLWEAGDPVSDLNNDGGIDGADVEVFFELWEGGGC